MCKEGTFLHLAAICFSSISALLFAFLFSGAILQYPRAGQARGLFFSFEHYRTRKKVGHFLGHFFKKPRKNAENYGTKKRAFWL